MSKIYGKADYTKGMASAQGSTDLASRMARESTEQALQSASQQYGLGTGAIEDYYSRALGAISPYQKIGTEALDLYKNVLGGDLGSYTGSPYYKFRLAEGLKAMESSAAARGNLLSGAQLKGTQQYAQDLASQDLQNYLSNIYGLAGMGLTAGQTAGGYAGSAGQSLAGLYSGLGQTQAGLYSGLGQTQAGLYSGLGQTQAGLYSQQAQAKSNLMSDILGAGGFLGGIYLGKKF